MKVLVFPNRYGANPYFQMFLLGLKDAGIEDVRLLSVLRLRSGFDAMHLHHPDHAVTQGGWLKSLVLVVALLCIASYARLTGRPVVWMVHDAEPWVRRNALLALFMKAITNLTTAYVFLNTSSQKIFYRNNSEEVRKPFCVIPHSRFQTTLYSAARVREHRQAHGIRDTDILIGFLGSITSYKGLECVNLIPDQARSGRAVKLAVCGGIDAFLPRNYVENILCHRSPEAYVQIPKRLTDEELALWIQSSDAVLLSYSGGSNSGMAHNVLSNHGRIIASERPMFQELAERCGPSWIRCVDTRSSAAVGEIVDCLEIWMEQEPDFDRLEAILAEGDPAENGRKLLDFYRRLRQHGTNLKLAGRSPQTP